MAPASYQVEMNAENHGQLGYPGLTHLTRAAAVETIRTALSTHGRVFTVKEDGEVVSFLNERGGALAIIRPVRALVNGSG